MINNTLERQLFDWKDWDQVSLGIFQCDEITLKVPMGEFEVGAKFACAVFDTENSLLTLYETDDENSITHTFTLKITVGAKIKNYP